MAAGLDRWQICGSSCGWVYGRDDIGLIETEYQSQNYNAVMAQLIRETLKFKTSYK